MNLMNIWWRVVSWIANNNFHLNMFQKCFCWREITNATILGFFKIVFGKLFWWLIWPIQNDAKTWKRTETLTNWYSYESTQLERSNAYQHDRIWIIFKSLCVLCDLDNFDAGTLLSVPASGSCHYLWIPGEKACMGVR